jgi:ribosomal protein S18 acetylase RimI-like enzyme
MVIFCSSPDLKKLFADFSGRAQVIRLQAKGGSMYPFIKSGDWVVASLLEEDEGLKKGEIVLFEKDGYFYAHRIIRIRAGRFITKGDFSSAADGALERKDVVARISGIERGGRTVNFTSPSCRLLSVFLADFYPFFRFFFFCVEKAVTLVFKAFSLLQRSGLFRLALKKLFKVETAINMAQEEDREALKDLYETTLPDIASGVRETAKEGFWLVARLKKKIVGSVVLSKYASDNSLWLIHGLVVKPLFRGRGIASALIYEVLMKAEHSGAKQIGLFVDKGNTPAIACYQRSGFRSGLDHPKEFNVLNEVYLVYEFK